MLFSSATTLGALIIYLAQWGYVHALPASRASDLALGHLDKFGALQLRDNLDSNDVLARKADHSNMTIERNAVTYGDADIQKILDAINTICTETGCDGGHSVDIPFSDAVDGGHEKVEGHLTVRAEAEYDSVERRDDMVQLIYSAFQGGKQCEPRTWTPWDSCCSDTFPPKCKQYPGDSKHLTHCSTPNYMQITTWSKQGTQMGSMKINLQSVEPGATFDCANFFDAINNSIGPFLGPFASIIGTLKLACQ